MLVWGYDPEEATMGHDQDTVPHIGCITMLIHVVQSSCRLQEHIQGPTQDECKFTGRISQSGGY